MVNTKSRKQALEKYAQGSRFQNKHGEWFSVIEYKNCTDVLIKFDIDLYPRVVKSKDIIRRALRARNGRTIMGTACVGEGLYLTSYSTGRATPAYQKYTNIIERCYFPNNLVDARNYKDCRVSDEWLNYQNFARWYYQQPGADLGFQIDKDLTGSRIYGPEYCYLLPKEINSTIRRVTGKINTHLPRGVSLSKDKLYPYVSTYRDDKHSKLSKFLTINEAREHYLFHTKRKMINIAKQYGNNIHQDVVGLLEEFDWSSI